MIGRTWDRQFATYALQPGDPLKGPADIGFGHIVGLDVLTFWHRVLGYPVIGILEVEGELFGVLGIRIQPDQ